MAYRGSVKGVVLIDPATDLPYNGSYEGVVIVDDDGNPFAVTPLSDALVTATGGSDGRTLADIAGDLPNIENWRSLNGVVRTDAQALQAAIDALVAVGGYPLQLNPSMYVFGTSNIALSRKVPLVGRGQNSTFLQTSVVGTNPFLSLTGSWGTTDQVRGVVLQDLQITKPVNDGVGKGIKFTECSYFDLIRVGLQYFSRGIDAVDAICGGLHSCVIDHNVRGVSGSYGSHSRPNSWEIRGGIVNGNSQFGVIFDDPSCLTIGGKCTFETNGSGTSSFAAVYINGDPVDGNEGLIIEGADFEGNAGAADIYVDSNSGLDGMHKLGGAQFNRTSASVYVTNNIVLNKPGAGMAQIDVRGCAFGGFNGYTEDAARRYIAVTNPVNGKWWISGLHDGSNLFASATALPDLYAVAKLPAAPPKGARAYVTDANSTTFLSTVAAGGSNNVPVVFDGTNWKIG